MHYNLPIPAKPRTLNPVIPSNRAPSHISVPSTTKWQRINLRVEYYSQPLTYVDILKSTKKLILPDGESNPELHGENVGC
jgi:hypothetical protein